MSNCSYILTVWQNYILSESMEIAGKCKKKEDQHQVDFFPLIVNPLKTLHYLKKTIIFNKNIRRILVIHFRPGLIKLFKT